MPKLSYCAQIRSLMFVFILTIGVVDSLESLQHAVKTALPGPLASFASSTASIAKVLVTSCVTPYTVCEKLMAWPWSAPCTILSLPA